ncbi:BrnA antitoxin family protein [Chlorobium ferrooxidans]|uniref:BrnA antitoxin family protein n=1 Tax=Chlorobium ferrooxidans TaxID=84205 RepID=UPI001E55172F|nr:BrnA antitoxin family protein [Chlorobium ferrooxidans]
MIYFSSRSSRGKTLCRKSLSVQLSSCPLRKRTGPLLRQLKVILTYNHTPKQLNGTNPSPAWSSGRSENKKLLVSVRYSPEVIAYFKSTGEGW